MKNTLYVLLIGVLISGCAANILSDMEAKNTQEFADKIAHERAMLRAIVEQRNELGCEAFESLVAMQVISMEADSIMENTYYK